MSWLCFGCVLIGSWLYPRGFLVVFVASRCFLGCVSIVFRLCLVCVLVVSWWLLGGICRVPVVSWWSCRAAAAETTANIDSNKKRETVLLGLYAGFMISIMVEFLFAGYCGCELLVSREVQGCCVDDCLSKLFGK